MRHTMMTPQPQAPQGGRSDPPDPTVTPKVAIALLGGRLTASQIENLVRSGCTTLATPASGRGVARRFTVTHLFELAVGGELLALGYEGLQLRFSHSFIIESKDWKRLCDPDTRAAAKGYLFLLPYRTDAGSGHLPVFEASLAGGDVWLSDEAPSATVIALAKLFTAIEQRFLAFVETSDGETQA